MPDKMVNLKITKNDRKKEKAEFSEAMTPKYPWGLTIDLNNEVLEKLGIDTLPNAGEALTLVAKVEVVTAELRKRNDGDKKSMSLQITDMALGPETKDDDIGAKLYDSK